MLYIPLCTVVLGRPQVIIISKTFSPLKNQWPRGGIALVEYALSKGAKVPEKSLIASSYIRVQYMTKRDDQVTYLQVWSQCECGTKILQLLATSYQIRRKNQPPREVILMPTLQRGAVSFPSDENSGFRGVLHGDTKVGGILIIKWSHLGGAGTTNC